MRKLARARTKSFPLNFITFNPPYVKIVNIINSQMGFQFARKDSDIIGILVELLVFDLIVQHNLSH